MSDYADSLCCSIQACSLFGWTRRAPPILTEGSPLGRCLSRAKTLTLLRPRMAATSVTVSSFCKSAGCPPFVATAVFVRCLIISFLQDFSCYQVYRDEKCPQVRKSLPHRRAGLRPS